jgi:chaperonin GroES
VQFEVGEFKPIKVPSGRSIQDAIYQLKFNEPSLVLFNLLGTMIQAAKDVTSVQDIMTGGPGSAGSRETATTSMIRIQEGVKVFSAIYKRVYRALKIELKKLFKLNSRYLQPQQYFNVLDSQELEQIGLADYQGDGTDVQPVADPQLATPILAMAKTQAIMGIIQHPLVNDEEVLRRFFEAHEIPNPEGLFVPQEQRQPPPDPELMLKAQIAASEHTKRQSEIVANYAKALKDIANAESAEVGIQLQAYAQGLKSIIEGWGGQGSVGGMAQLPGNEGGVQDGGIPDDAGAVIPAQG